MQDKIGTRDNRRIPPIEPSLRIPMSLDPETPASPVDRRTFLKTATLAATGLGLASCRRNPPPRPGGSGSFAWDT